MNAEHFPSKIQIRFEGKLPSFGKFYLEQLSELARFRGIEWSMTVAKSQGVREARDWHLRNCATDLLWMLDDDVIYEFDCLKYLDQAVHDLGILALKSDIAYLCGTKGDVNNRRSYQDFDMKIHRREDVFDNCAFTWFYDKADCFGKYARIYTADTGNMLFNMKLVRKHKLTFKQFSCSTNSGGEDTVFALECGKKRLKAYIVPSARSYHLEKPVVNFDEFNARAEMVLRVCDLRKYPAEQVAYLKKVFMCWTMKTGHDNDEVLRREAEETKASPSKAKATSKSNKPAR